MKESARQHVRHQHYRDLSMVYEGSSEGHIVHVPDLSVAGMFINTPRHYPEGTVLKLNFFLNRSGYEINARAEVRYCLPGAGIGVEFIDLSAEARQAIEAELAGYG
jgi:hypothetical protein